MANIFVNKDNKNTFTATANRFFTTAMRKSAIALADAHNCTMTEVTVKVDKKPTKRYRFTAKSASDRDAFVTAFESEYASAHDAYEKAKAEEKAKSEPTASARKPKADAPKKAKGKMTLEAFVRANDLCTLEEAKAHGFVGTKKDLWN